MKLPMLMLMYMHEWVSVCGTKKQIHLWRQTMVVIINIYYSSFQPIETDQKSCFPKILTKLMLLCSSHPYEFRGGNYYLFWKSRLQAWKWLWFFIFPYMPPPSLSSIQDGFTNNNRKNNLIKTKRLFKLKAATARKRKDKWAKRRNRRSRRLSQVKNTLWLSTRRITRNSLVISWKYGDHMIILCFGGNRSFQDQQNKSIFEFP